MLDVAAVNEAVGMERTGPQNFVDKSPLHSKWVSECQRLL